MSNHADITAYTPLLKSFKSAIETEARRLTSADVLAMPDETDLGRVQLQQRATIIAEDGYSPALTMIDQDFAERNAMDAIWPQIPLRLFQFHSMHNIKSKAEAVFGRKAKIHTQSFMSAFRRLQRCPSEDVWQEAWLTFEADVRSVGGENGGRHRETLSSYLL